jgi:hypothetical protein
MVRYPPNRQNLGTRGRLREHAAEKLSLHRLGTASWLVTALVWTGQVEDPQVVHRDVHR